MLADHRAGLWCYLLIAAGVHRLFHPEIACVARAPLRWPRAVCPDQLYLRRPRSSQDREIGAVIRHPVEEPAWISRQNFNVFTREAVRCRQRPLAGRDEANFAVRFSRLRPEE